MERRLLVNSIYVLLICLFAGVCNAQNGALRDSSDPYYSSNNTSAKNSTFPIRVAENTLQPRMPNVERPAIPDQGFSASQRPPTQLQPGRFVSDPNGGFRPRSQPKDISFEPEPNRGVAPLDRSRSKQIAFRTTTPRADGLQQPGQAPQQPTNQNRVFQEIQNRDSTGFQQSGEFFTPVDQRPSNNQNQLPRESPRQLSPQTSSNQPAGFTNTSPAGTSMLASTSDTRVSEQNEFEPGRVVAIVGGHPIFVGDMLFEVNQLMDRLMPGAPAKAKDSQRSLVIKRMVPKFIDAKLLLIDTLESLPENADFDTIVKSAEEDFDKKVLPTLLEKSDVKSSIELDAKLRAQGGSLRQLRYKWAEEQLIKYFMGRKLDVDTEVTHQEMLENYQNNRDQYHQKARVRWEELSIRFDKVPNQSEAEQLLKQMGNEVVYGAPFDAVARRSSQGFTAFEGGKHDWTSLGSLVYKDVEQALFSIPVNELSDVIPSRDGLHIVRVLERTKESYTPFLEAQVEIRVKLENEKRAQAFEDHLTELRQRIPFEVQMDDIELPPHLANGTNSNFK